MYTFRCNFKHCRSCNVLRLLFQYFNTAIGAHLGDKYFANKMESKNEKHQKPPNEGGFKAAIEKQNHPIDAGKYFLHYVSLRSIEWINLNVFAIATFNERLQDYLFLKE